MACTTNNLQDIIIEHIKQHGPMALGDFITYAMTHPEYGYYTRNDPLGVVGDFTTAPEISQIFGELIGAWVIDIWMQMGKPAFNLIECGPGRGTLMADIMRVGKKLSEFTESVQIGLIETQGVLRKKQKENLLDYKVSWYESLSDIKSDKPCIILGNEFLDALPIEQLIRGEDGWQQRVISLGDDENALKFGTTNADNALLSLLPDRTESHQVYEVSPARIRFTEICAKMIEDNRGAVLFIDYGHDKSHYGDTLQALRKHQFSGVLEHIGDSDITSHIDFDALCCALQSRHVGIMPIVSQRQFLLSLGIEARANALASGNTNKQSDIRMDMNRLIGEDQMGNLFKVMCFYKGAIIPCGFE